MRDKKIPDPDSEAGHSDHFLVSGAIKIQEDLNDFERKKQAIIKE